jgi:hypothetical protein
MSTPKPPPEAKIERGTKVMGILGVGVGLFYSSITTTAVTALDSSRSSLAGGIIYMCQIAGGAVLAGFGFVVALVFVSASRPTCRSRVTSRKSAPP